MITFTPQQGTLVLKFVDKNQEIIEKILQEGDTFLQKDIENKKLFYHHIGKTIMV